MLLNTGLYFGSNPFLFKGDFTPALSCEKALNALRSLANLGALVVKTTVEMPERVVTQGMGIGDFDDVRALAEAVG